jgi:hypothetical protein
MGAYFVALLLIYADESPPTQALQAPPIISPHSSQALETQALQL